MAETPGLQLGGRWSGRVGHPRLLADAVKASLEDLGYHCDDKLEMRGEPLAGVAEFEGWCSAKVDGPARLEDRGILVFGGVLAVIGLLIGPTVNWGVGAGLLVLGLALLIYAWFHTHRHLIRVEWRGEAYEAGQEVEREAIAAGVRRILSDVRVTLYYGRGHPKGPRELTLPMRPDSRLERDVMLLEERLATLVERWADEHDGMERGNLT